MEFTNQELRTNVSDLKTSESFNSEKSEKILASSRDVEVDLLNAFKFLFNSDDEIFAKDQISKMTELERLVLLRVSNQNKN